MHRISCALLITAVCACTDDPPIMQPVGVTSALEPLAAVAPNAEYTIAILPDLGGNLNRGSSINKQGWVAGYSQPIGDSVRIAVQWRNGVLYRLGSLGGDNSNVQWDGQNDHGAVVGIAHTATPDPLNEDWSCSGFLNATPNTCLGFLYDDGRMKPLPTLGGNNGFATGVNNRNQIVGWAENRVVDPTCVAPGQVLQFRAVLWEPFKGKKQELRPFGSDPTSAATAINNKGQVVGISGECGVAIGRLSALHALIWEENTVTEIPHLGGEGWHTPMAINDRGTVVGFSNILGGTAATPILRAFLWTKTGGTKEIGKLPGDTTSQARGINIKDQVVGISIRTGLTRAFLWRNGRMHDLNDLVGPGYPNRLISAQDINDAGQITGAVVEASSGRTRTYVATPRP